MYHTMTIAGVQRDLPICKVSDDLYIGAFVIFGDVELTVKTAEALLKKAPEYDYMISAEAKCVPSSFCSSPRHSFSTRSTPPPSTAATPDWCT